MSPGRMLYLHWGKGAKAQSCLDHFPAPIGRPFLASFTATRQAFQCLTAGLALLDVAVWKVKDERCKRGYQRLAWMGGPQPFIDNQTWPPTCPSAGPGMRHDSSSADATFSALRLDKKGGGVGWGRKRAEEASPPMGAAWHSSAQTQESS